MTGLQFAAEHVDIGQGFQCTAYRLSVIQGPCFAKTIVRLLLCDDLARRRNEQREGFGVTVGRNHHDRDVRAARSVRWQRQFDFQALVSDALGVEAVDFGGRSTVFDFDGQGRS